MGTDFAVLRALTGTSSVLRSGLDLASAVAAKLMQDPVQVNDDYYHCARYPGFSKTGKDQHHLIGLFVLEQAVRLVACLIRATTGCPS